MVRVEIDSVDELRDDAVFGGALKIRQRRRGYCFNIDALWLVAAAREHARGVICDLGAGSGVVGLALGLVPGVTRVILVERQPGLAKLSRHNARQLSDQTDVQVRVQDLRQLGELGPVDLVVSNPPYFCPGSSRPAQDDEINQARRQLHGDLGDFARAAAGLLTGSGRWLAVLPSSLVADLVSLCQREGLHLESYRRVYARPDQEARLVLISARPVGVGLPQQLPPVVERDERGHESAAAAMLRRSGWLTEDGVAGPLRLEAGVAREGGL